MHFHYMYFFWCPAWHEQTPTYPLHPEQNRDIIKLIDNTILKFGYNTIHSDKLERRIFAPLQAT